MDSGSTDGRRRTLGMALIGGGEGAFIGNVHRMAAHLDGRIELRAGVFGRDAERSRRAGQHLYGLPAERCYPDVRTLLAAAAQSRGDAIDFVTVATPNSSHFEIASAALEAGFHVMVDKPLAMSVREAKGLAERAAAAGRHLGLSHNYTGYPMVKEARSLVRAGALGAIRRVAVEYLQGWLTAPIERSGHKQAAWRTDPARAGLAGCIGDIGSHAENLVRYVTGLEIESLCADLSTFVPDRALDDDGNILLRFAGGARGVLLASQVAAGVENGLRLAVYGERGGIEWAQETPSTLTVRRADAPAEIRTRGMPGLSAAAAAAGRLPAGHPEGFIEAFANLYLAFADLIETGGTDADLPGTADGIRGMAFIEAAVASSRAGADWVALADYL